MYLASCTSLPVRLDLQHVGGKPLIGPEPSEPPAVAHLTLIMPVIITVISNHKPDIPNRHNKSSSFVILVVVILLKRIVTMVIMNAKR